MKIKKIAKLCKDAGCATLLNYTDKEGAVHQWIGEVSALYPVEGMPPLRAEHLAAAFELNEKQKRDMRIRESDAPAEIQFGDIAEGEQLAEKMNVRCVFCGRVLLPVKVGRDVYWLDEKLLAPAQAEYENIELYLRKAGGTRIFALKSGLLCVGIVCPMGNMEQLHDTLLEIVGG